MCRIHIFYILLRKFTKIKRGIFMSGPGLHHVDSHAAIHEAAIHEAEELNDILAKLLREKELEKALEVAYITVEHWESRTLRHADAEERGLYKIGRAHV